MRRTPDLAHWNGIDQLAENDLSHSPYAYVQNNPVMLWDVDGRISKGYWVNGISSSDIPEGSAIPTEGVSMQNYNRGEHGSVENYLGLNSSNFVGAGEGSNGANIQSFLDHGVSEVRANALSNNGAISFDEFLAATDMSSEENDQRNDTGADDDPKFFNRLKGHYEGKTKEPFNLTKKEFLYLVSKGKIDYKNATLVDKKNKIYEASINFYDSGFDLANSFGRATVTYREINGSILYRSFYDKYDFDPKDWGTRSTWNEIKTRAYNIYSSGKAFEVLYNQNYIRK